MIDNEQEVKNPDYLNMLNPLNASEIDVSQGKDIILHPTINALSELYASKLQWLILDWHHYTCGTNACFMQLLCDKTSLDQ